MVTGVGTDFISELATAQPRARELGNLATISTPREGDTHFTLCLPRHLPRLVLGVWHPRFLIPLRTIMATPLTVGQLTYT